MTTFAEICFFLFGATYNPLSTRDNVDYYLTVVLAAVGACTV
jgi:hypothetical protein